MKDKLIISEDTIMRADLEELLITDSELKRLTRFQVKHNKNLSVCILISILPLFILILMIGIIIQIISGEKEFDGELFIAFCLTIVCCYWPIKFWADYYKNYKKKPKLMKEVGQYNQLIKDIHTLDQLEAVGNPVMLNEREKVIEAVRLSRANLVRALETERILKENPKFRPDRFNIDLTGLRTLQATEKATEYGRFLDEALQIGVSVQDEMRKIEQKRLK